MNEIIIKILEKFIQEKLPEPERNRVILIVDEVPITWQKMLEEFKKGGDFADKIEIKFKEMIK